MQVSLSHLNELITVITPTLRGRQVAGNNSPAVDPKHNASHATYDTRSPSQ